MKTDFLKLYERNVDAVYRYCYRKVGDKGTAKLLTEETFKKMWDYMSPSSSVLEIESTLFSIASRVIRKHLEKSTIARPDMQFKFS